MDRFRVIIDHRFDEEEQLWRSELAAFQESERELQESTAATIGRLNALHVCIYNSRVCRSTESCTDVQV